MRLQICVVVVLIGGLSTGSPLLALEMPKEWKAPYVAHHSIELPAPGSAPTGDAVDIVDQILEAAQANYRRVERGVFECAVEAGELRAADLGLPPERIQVTSRSELVQFDIAAGLFRSHARHRSAGDRLDTQAVLIRTPAERISLRHGRVVRTAASIPEDESDRGYWRPFDWQFLGRESVHNILSPDRAPTHWLPQSEWKVQFAGWVDERHVEICWRKDDLKFVYSIVYDAQQNFTPVTAVLRNEVVSIDPPAFGIYQLTTTRWKPKTGTLVPVLSRSWHTSGSPSYQAVQLTWLSVNQPLGPEDFTLESLLLPPDTRIQQKVDGKEQDIGVIDRHGNYRDFSKTTAATIIKPVPEADLR